MTMLSSGAFQCDKCGGDCGNGGVRECLVVSDLDPDNEGHVRNLHFCRDVKNGDGTVTKKGCASKVLSSTNLKHYKESRDVEAIDQ